MKQRHFITLITLSLLILAFVVAALFFETEKDHAQNKRATNNSDVLIRDYSVKAGDPSAKVTIVEFLDPACRTCAQFHPFVKQLMQHHPGKVNLVVRYLPFHKGSDQMVAILEAARKQNKFWEVLELMFDTQSQWTINHVAYPDVFWELIDRAGVDPERIKQDMRAPEIVQIIQQDLADGKFLGADKTPSFFVNGKPLRNFGFEQLEALVDSEVGANY
ncbi:MAG: thioredoxin domain-containing protein [Pseudomonadales bacterium]|nr:thioredoxin domain-containing protein [Pseudomonadales bacterium]